MHFFFFLISYIQQKLFRGLWLGTCPKYQLENSVHLPKYGVGKEESRIEMAGQKPMATKWAGETE